MQDSLHLGGLYGFPEVFIKTRLLKKKKKKLDYFSLQKPSGAASLSGETQISLSLQTEALSPPPNLLHLGIFVL